MGTVVVGYVPKPEGEAALAAGINEAKLRGSKLVVVNSHRGGQEFDRAKAQAAEDERSSHQGEDEPPGWPLREGVRHGSGSAPRRRNG